jgi:hypothetical protein
MDHPKYRLQQTLHVGGTVADDLIWGAAAIGAEIGVDERKTFYLLARRFIPARKIGGLWVASRRELRAALCGAAAEDAK